MNQPLRSNRKSDSIISHVLVVHCIAMYFVQVTIASVVLMSFNQLIQLLYITNANLKIIIIIKARKEGSEYSRLVLRYEKS